VRRPSGAFAGVSCLQSGRGLPQSKTIRLFKAASVLVQKSRSNAVTIARHFNAGFNPKKSQVPEGRLKNTGLNVTTDICGDEFQPCRWD
jgi:hypothetical protein